MKSNQFTFIPINKVQEYQPNIVINPPVVSKSQGIQLAPQAQDILISSFVKLILGKPGSGKTHLISQMIKNSLFYYRKFDRILYVGITRYQGCIHDKYNTNSYLDVQWIYDQLKLCNGWAKNILIIFDDVISSFSKGRLQQLFYNRRHIVPQATISMIITTQKFTSVPTWLRVIANQLFLFKVNNQELKYILGEINCNKDKIVMNKIVTNLKINQFVYINLNTGKLFDNTFNQV